MQLFELVANYTWQGSRQLCSNLPSLQKQMFVIKVRDSYITCYHSSFSLFRNLHNGLRCKLSIASGSRAVKHGEKVTGTQMGQYRAFSMRTCKCGRLGANENDVRSLSNHSYSAIRRGEDEMQAMERNRFGYLPRSLMLCNEMRKYSITRHQTNVHYL